MSSILKPAKFIVKYCNKADIRPARSTYAPSIAALLSPHLSEIHNWMPSAADNDEGDAKKFARSAVSAAADGIMLTGFSFPIALDCLLLYCA